MVIKEYWLNLKYENFDHYQVSNFGRIRAVERDIINNAGKPQRIPSKMLKLRTNGIEPHLFCELYFTNFNGKKYRKTVYVHRVVMEHFGKKPIQTRTKYQQYVEHIDGDYNNNHINNLRWITWEQLYKKQLNNGRVERMDLYKDSPIWKKHMVKI